MKNLNKTISLRTAALGLFGLQIIMIVCLYALLHRVDLLESIHYEPAQIKE
mgnify:FL=1